MDTGSLGRRTAIAVAILAVLALPAGVLRVLCVGNACEEAKPAPRVPFCSLPEETRHLISAGFREGRSPDVFAITKRTFDASVPMAISVPGSRLNIPEGVSLDRMAPTIASAIGLERPHPEVRSGHALDLSASEAPRLALIVVWKGVGGADLEGVPTPVFDDLGGISATIGSFPPDPTAVMATIGTGGLPRQHGITGSAIRDDSGGLVEPASQEAPVSIIATLADDLDEDRGGSPRIGLVGTSPTDRAVIGGDWYLDADDDTVVITKPKNVLEDAKHLLKLGFAGDNEPDLLVIALEGSVASMDKATGIMLRKARGIDPTSVVAVAGTGSSDPSFPTQKVVSRLDGSLSPGIVESAGEGGFFLNQKVLADKEIASRDVVAALTKMGLFADVFTGTAVEFARYC